ncbi:MAG: hypothetical protein HND48_07185 [Chloroflexi bacterium]|nr:hypothetical protein [Chloroflexota bacterium]
MAQRARNRSSSSSGSLLAAWQAHERDLRECGLPQFVVRSILQARRDIDVAGEVARVQRLDAHL